MRRKLTPNERIAFWEHMNRKCAYCGCDIEFDTMQIDHVEPIMHGGADEFYNMMPACRSCNHRKHTLTISGFRKAIQRQLAVLNRDSVTYRNAKRFSQITENHEPIVFYFERMGK